MNIYARCKVLLPNSGDLTQRKQVDSHSPLAVTLRHFSIIAVQSNICQLAISRTKALKIDYLVNFRFYWITSRKRWRRQAGVGTGRESRTAGRGACRLTCIPSDHEFTYRLQYCKLVANFRPINHPMIPWCGKFLICWSSFVSRVL